MHSKPLLANSLLTTDRLGVISRKARRRGVICTYFDIDIVNDHADHKLFAPLPYQFTVCFIFFLPKPLTLFLQPPKKTSSLSAATNSIYTTQK